MSKISCIAFFFLLLFSCNYHSNKENQREQDLVQKNFIDYIEENQYKFNEYLVIEYKKCHYCDNLIEMALRNELLLHNPNLSVIFCTYEQPKSAIYKKYSEFSNFLIYELYKGFPPLLEEKIRYYQVFEDSILLKPITVDGFEEFLLSKLSSCNDFKH